MARLLAALALICLLAGCSSPPSDPSDGAGADAPTAPPAQPPAADADAPPTPAQQQEDLAWIASGVACAHAQQTQEAIYATLLPELDGITYASAPVDPASIGQAWTVTVADAVGLVGFEVTFWKGAVGPGGQAIAFQVGLPPFEGDSTVEGEVPAGAEFVSVFACSAEPGSATYVADLMGGLALL